MRRRCNNPKGIAYSHYGGRGITYDPAWDQFENFWHDMGDVPEGLTLDRIDNDGNYCKANCRWATREQQSQNKSDVVLYEWNGERHCLAEWARRLGIRHGVLYGRLKEFGWPLERVLTEPVQQRPNPQYELDGERHDLAGWARISGMKRRTLSMRLQRGWSLERALNERVR